jgi:hypothetical protein
MTGANITITGTPASDSRRIASTRRSGVAARGSMLRESLRSRLVTEIAARVSPSDAASASKSRSRRIRADLVITEKGCRKRTNTSITPRVTPSPRSWG